MGRTALYQDPVPFKSVVAKVQLEHDVLVVEMPNGWTQRHVLDGVSASIADGFTLARRDGGRIERRFVRMLLLDHLAQPSGGTGSSARSGDRGSRHVAVITPPEQGAVAPNVVRVPEAPHDAAIVDAPTWEALAEWLVGGGRLGALAVADLARLACIATPQFAALIGEVAAQRALDLVWIATSPLRGIHDLDEALQPLVDAARHSTRATEALVAALAHAAGVTRRRGRVK
ncbi:MAG: hypothetical protein ABI467_26385 [Kofleriaceae bacterium]